MGLGSFNAPQGNISTVKEYVGYVTDPVVGPIVVTALNSLESNYLGDINWVLNDIQTIDGTVDSDENTFTIYTYLIQNYCTNNVVTDLKVDSGSVIDAKTIRLSYSGGLGTISSKSIHGMFCIKVYPGDFVTKNNDF